MIGFDEDESPQLPPCWICDRDSWRRGERWYFVCGPYRVEPYCQDCVPDQQRDVAVFVQNGQETVPGETDAPNTKEKHP